MSVFVLHILAHYFFNCLPCREFTLAYLLFECGFLCAFLQLCQRTEGLVEKSFIEMPLCRLYFMLKICVCSTSPRILVFHSLTTVEEQTTSLK